MVKLLLDMKERLDTVLIEAFGRAEAFGHALKDAFEHFINQRANRCFCRSASCCCCQAHFGVIPPAASAALHALGSLCDP